MLERFSMKSYLMHKLLYQIKVKKKVSPVLTFEEWQAYHTEIREEKENKDKQVQERKRLRL